MWYIVANKQKAKNEYVIEEQRLFWKEQNAEILLSDLRVWATAKAEIREIVLHQHKGGHTDWCNLSGSRLT